MQESDTRTIASSKQSHPIKRKASDAAGPQERKSTYYKRKDEIQTLQAQIQHLQNKLSQHKNEMLRGQFTNAVLAENINLTSAMVAGLESMMTAHTLQEAEAGTPVHLHRHVHLSSDPVQRQATMTSLFVSNLPVAMRFMAERTRYLDLRVKHRHIKQLDLPNGDLKIEAMDIVPFDSGHSLRQVYDAFMHFHTHEEMAMSEKLGVLTVRESDDPDDFKISQTRLRTSTPGLEIETNNILTSFCASESPAYAVGMLDFVDQDELYPYRSDECARENVIYVVTFQELPSSDGTRPTIVMTRWLHVQLVQPSFPVHDATKAKIRQGMVEWCGLFPSVVKERLSTIPPTFHEDP